MLIINDIAVGSVQPLALIFHHCGTLDSFVNRKYFYRLNDMTVVAVVEV